MSSRLKSLPLFHVRQSLQLRIARRKSNAHTGCKAARDVRWMQRICFYCGGKKTKQKKRLDLPQAQQSIQMTVSCHEESVVCYFVENTTLWSYGGEKSKLLFSNTSAHSKDCDDRLHPAKHGPCQASLVFPRGLYKAKGELGQRWSVRLAGCTFHPETQNRFWEGCIGCANAEFSITQIKSKWDSSNWINSMQNTKWVAVWVWELLLRFHKKLFNVNIELKEMMWNYQNFVFGSVGL